jgi:hypothetical protein
MVCLPCSTNYGDPKGDAKAETSDVKSTSEAEAALRPEPPHTVSPEPLVWPEKDKMTWHWIQRNVPVNVWLSLGALLVAIFLAGFSIAAWQPISTALSNWANTSRATTDSFTPASVPAAAVASASLPAAASVSPPAVADQASKAAAERSIDPGIITDLKPKTDLPAVIIEVTKPQSKEPREPSSAKDKLSNSSKAR